MLRWERRDFGPAFFLSGERSLILAVGLTTKRPGFRRQGGRLERVRLGAEVFCGGARLDPAVPGR